MKNASKNKIPPCCDYCLNFGEVSNYMAFCSEHGSKFPEGYRRCKRGFHLDLKRYNNTIN